MLKQLSRSPIVPTIVGTFIWGYMMLMAHTLRWRMEGAEHAETLWRQKGPFIVVSWHSRIFLMPSIHMKFSEGWGPRPFPNTLMVSASRDGAFSKRSADLMKLHVVRGSAQTPGKTKDKRGYLGAREAMQAMSKGAALFLTVDGPKGPREHVGVGAIKLAQQMKAPILVYGVSAKGKRLKTWDRLVMALPFARGGVVFEEPIQTDKSMDTEALRELVERRLTGAIARADALSGLGPDPIPAPAVEPARPSVAVSKTVATDPDRSTVEPAGS
jgi:lysophospholipid acyltransferase (LPLAT)-like uncharacterized protein